MRNEGVSRIRQVCLSRDIVEDELLCNVNAWVRLSECRNIEKAVNLIIVSSYAWGEGLESGAKLDVV